MKEDIKITIYVPCRNYGKYLQQCLDSIKNQLFKEWELFIVNEDSSDDTEIISKNFIIQNADKMNMKYIHNISPQGIQKIANQIIEISQGKYIIRVDPDDWLDESALLVLFHKIENTEGCDLVYPDYYYVDEKGNIIANDRQLKFAVDEKVGIIPPNGACCLIRTRALKLMHGYSEKFKAQDGHELWFKLSSRMKSAHISIPLFFYRQHEKSLSRDNKKLFEARKSIYNTLSKSSSGDYKLNIVGVIPVKENFPNIKNIPFLKYGDKTLLEISIEQASKSKFLNNLVILGGEKKTLEYSKKIASKLGFNNLHTQQRNKDDLINSIGVPTLSLMRKAGQIIFEKQGRYPDLVIFLNLHAMNRKTEEIDQAISLIKLTNSDSVVSVIKERKPIFKYGDYGLKIINEGRLSDVSLQREILFSFEDSIIATWWEILLKDSIFGDRITPLELNIKNDNIKLNQLSE